jgi:hypothetical protein
MSRLARLAALLVGAWWLLGSLPAAQCPLPDQLDGGPCCTVAPPVIPVFPNFRQDAFEICWQDCGIDQVLTYNARWRTNPLAPLPCGEASTSLSLVSSAGVTDWSGVLRLQYARTWMEIDAAGLPLQVWRFLVNGDLRPRANLTTPCPAPPCAAAFNGLVRFTGYIDYAADCSLVPTVYQHAWMLSHVCDFIDHHPGFPRAGLFHPDRSYTFVGPAAGFVPGPIQPTEGTPGSPFESLRRRNLVPPPALATCNFEESLTFSLLPQQQFCLCAATPLAPPQFMLGALSIAGACGTLVATPGGPYLPGFLSMGIGTWTIPGVYPGVEALRWNTGGYTYTDPCAGVTQEVFFGVTTIGGYLALQLPSIGPGLPLPLTFIDQSNSLRPMMPNGTIMNVPYVSNHFIDLNH